MDIIFINKMSIKTQLRIMDNNSVFSIKGIDENGLPYIKFKIWRVKSTLFLLFNRDILLKYRMNTQIAFDKGLKGKDYKFFSRHYELYDYIKNKI